MKLNISDSIETALAYIILVIISCVFGVLASSLPLLIGITALSEISGIEIPCGSIIIFALIPSIELFIIGITDKIDSEAFWTCDLIFYALWIASLVVIGCIENKLKTGLNGTEAFIISMGMPVAFVMIIAFIVFIVSYVNRIATRQVDR